MKNLTADDRHKRAIKEAGTDAAISKGIDLGDLLDTIPIPIIDELRHVLESSDVSNRDIISAAIAGYLPRIVNNLRGLGFAPHRAARQRPRSIDRLAWESLEHAEQAVGLAKIELLRATLRLLAREGAGNLSLREALAEIDGLPVQNRPGPGDQDPGEG